MTFWEVAESWVKYVNLDACKVIEPLSRMLASAVLSKRSRTEGSLLPGITFIIMGRRNKVRMPSSEGGLVRYFDDEYKSRIMIEPKLVIVLVVAVAVVAVALRLM